VGAREGVSARERDVPRERLLQRDDRKRARKQPRGDSRRSDGDRSDNGGESRFHLEKMRRAVIQRQRGRSRQSSVASRQLVAGGDWTGDW